MTQPNSWSRWVFVIEPHTTRHPSSAEIKVNAWRAARRLFGPTCRIHITLYIDGSATLDIRAHAQSVFDPRYVAHVTEHWERWAKAGWGDRARVTRKLATVADAPTG